MMGRMAYKEKWGRPVRTAVERMALAPDGLSARAIHAGLAAGAVEGIAPADVPPPATVARWVHEHRRAAREVVGAAAGEDTLTVVAARLRRTLKREAGKAKTAAEVRAVAAAAREIAGLERDLARGADPGRTPRKAQQDMPAPASQDDAQRDFLERMARDASASASPGEARQDEYVRGAQPRTEQNGHRI